MCDIVLRIGNAVYVLPMYTICSSGMNQSLIYKLTISRLQSKDNEALGIILNLCLFDLFGGGKVVVFNSEDNNEKLYTYAIQNKLI